MLVRVIPLGVPEKEVLCIYLQPVAAPSEGASAVKGEVSGKVDFSLVWATLVASAGTYTTKRRWNGVMRLRWECCRPAGRFSPETTVRTAIRNRFRSPTVCRGKKIDLPNNETVRLQGVNNSAGRSESPPGISMPVVCTPPPLPDETPEFQSVWKRPGKYSNKLTIMFTPSSTSL